MRTPLLLLAWAIFPWLAASSSSPLPQIIPDALWNECGGFLFDSEQKFRLADLFAREIPDDDTLRRMETYVHCIDAIIESILENIGHVEEAAHHYIFDEEIGLLSRVILSQDHLHIPPNAARGIVGRLKFIL